MNIGEDCPYCDRENDYTDYEYYENGPYNHTCEHCGKAYILTVEFDPIYIAQKADCLNGSDHNWSNIFSNPKTQAEYEIARRCEDCKYSEIKMKA